MSKARRARLFLRDEGICGLCSLKISGDYDVEHRIPWAIAYDDSDENLYVAHKECHGVKTKADVKTIAKAKRLAGETGQNRQKKQIPSRPFQKGKKQQWPKRSLKKTNEAGNSESKSWRSKPKD